MLKVIVFSSGRWNGGGCDGCTAEPAGTGHAHEPDQHATGPGSSRFQLPSYSRHVWAIQLRFTRGLREDDMCEGKMDETRIIWIMKCDDVNTSID